MTFFDQQDYEKPEDAIKECWIHNKGSHSNREGNLEMKVKKNSSYNLSSIFKKIGLIDKKNPYEQLRNR